MNASNFAFSLASGIYDYELDNIACVFEQIQNNAVVTADSKSELTNRSDLAANTIFADHNATANAAANTSSAPPQPISKCSIM